MEYPELLKAYNDLYLANNQLSSGYEQCRLNLLSQEAHISSIIEHHSHPIYVDFLIAIVSILVYHYTRKYWDLLQELAFEAWCWAGMKIMPDKSFDCRACWRAAQVAEGLCQNCYKEAHGAEPVQEEKKEQEIVLSDETRLKASKVIATIQAIQDKLKLCSGCGERKPIGEIYLENPLVCASCFHNQTGDPKAAIRANENF